MTSCWFPTHMQVDLGIAISPKLLWNDQVNKVRSKANVPNARVNYTIYRGDDCCQREEASVSKTCTRQFWLCIPSMVPTIQ
jgi:hypothetical protein